MNGNDLMNALSGLDPKYIDEAAFELHDSPAKIKRAKISRFKKVIFVTVPAAAVIFLTLTVTLPFLMRMSSSESASAPASDSAAYEAEENAAADSAPAYDSAEEAAAPAAETEEAAAPAAESEEAAASVFGAEESAGAEKSETMDAADEYAATAESEVEQAPLFEKAEYKDGILTVEINGSLPEDTEETEYAVTGTDSDGSEKTFAEGKLGDVMIGTDPLILDLSGLKLPEGEYKLKIGDDSIEFLY